MGGRRARTSSKKCRKGVGRVMVTSLWPVSFIPFRKSLEKNLMH